MVKCVVLAFFLFAGETLLTPHRTKVIKSNENLKHKTCEMMTTQMMMLQGHC